jgi:hypothetical protein
MIISLNSIIQLIWVMVMDFVFFEVGNKLVNIVKIIFNLKGLLGK